MAVTKSVSIRDDQEKWLEGKPYSLSKLLQDAIDVEIQKEKKGK